MDHYGLCTLEDAPRIADELRAGHGVWFGLGLHQSTALTVFMAPPAPVIGDLPYGGGPYGRYCVGVAYLGCFHFTFGDDPLFPRYVGEKLGMNDESDAEEFTRMLDAIRQALIEKEVPHESKT